MNTYSFMQHMIPLIYDYVFEYTHALPVIDTNKRRALMKIISHSPGSRA